jgi:hypothetical protein
MVKHLSKIIRSETVCIFLLCWTFMSVSTQFLIFFRGIDLIFNILIMSCFDLPKKNLAIRRGNEESEMESFVSALSGQRARF